MSTKDISVMIPLSRLQESMWNAFTNGRELPEALVQKAKSKGHELKFETYGNYFNMAIQEAETKFTEVEMRVNRHTPETCCADSMMWAAILHGHWHAFIDQVRKHYK